MTMSPVAVVEDQTARHEIAVPGRYRHDWQLFVDWCTATDGTALPTDPDTVVAFLDAHPATRTTNRRRLTAIRWTHRHARELAPHRTAELRSRVLPHSDRTIDVETIRPLLEQMPTSGWTAGLVGRRDALLLVLAAHGVPYTPMEQLHRRDATVDDNRCLVVTLPTAVVVRIPAAPVDPRTCPVAVYLRWARLLAYHDRYPSARALEKALRATQPIGDTTERYQALPEPSRDGRDPLLPTIDRWGQFGTLRGSHRERWGMDADSAAKIVNAHLAGEAVPRYLTEKAEPHSVVDVYGDDQDRIVARPLPPARSDGAGLRRKDTQRLSDLEESFDEIERRAADLANWVASLIATAADDADPMD